MSSVTVLECFDLIQEVITHYKNNPTLHDYTDRCTKQNIAFVSVLFNKLQMKVEEVRMNRQFQTYIEKLKPLLKAEQIQRNVRDNMMRLHKASNSDSVQSQKLTIQHICQELGLKNVEGNDLKSYISFDANEFYLEVSFNDVSPDRSEVGDTKVSLVSEGKPEIQSSVSTALNKKDYQAFQAHLKGYISVFNIPLEPRVRPILFSALRALEADLLAMKGSEELTIDSINKSSIGHVIRSSGGMGVKILYYYNNMLPSNTPVLPGSTPVLPSSTPYEDNANSCTIGVECSNINQLPTQPLYCGRTEFKPLSQSNSEYVEATFVMKLKPPLVMTIDKMNALLKKLGNNNLIKQGIISTTFLQLLLSNAGLTEKCIRSGIRVLKHMKLKHRYYIPTDQDKAVIIHRIPFSHPSQVSLIMSTVRQQEMFNRMILSCYSNISSDTTTDTSLFHTIDMTIKPCSAIECIFAHPHRPDLSILNLHVTPVSVEALSPETLQNSVLSTILTRYMSIPLVVHGLLKILTHHHAHNITVPKPVQPDEVEHEPAKTQPLFGNLSSLLSEPSSILTLNQSVAPPPLPPPPQQQQQQGTTAPTSQPSMLTPPPMSQQKPLPAMSSPYNPDSMKTLPSPPDMVAHKRKRPVTLCDTEGPLMKKPTKLVKMSEVPGIPNLSPMSSLSTGGINRRHQQEASSCTGGIKLHQMRPIGPPSLKPAPIHPTSTSPQGRTIPCLSPAPHMIRAPTVLQSQPTSTLQSQPTVAPTKSSEQDPSSTEDNG